MYRVRAFNRLTGESMERPEMPRIMAFDHMSDWLPAYYSYVSAMKVFEAFAAQCPAFPMWERPKMKHAERKGIPVPRTGYRRWHSGANKGKSGVIANSHVVSHRYMSEGDKGPSLRREIKRKERVIVALEIAEGLDDYYADVEDEYLSSLPEWELWEYEGYPEYDEYGYECGDPYCDICGTGSEED